MYVHCTTINIIIIISSFYSIFGYKDKSVFIYRGQEPLFGGGVGGEKEAWGDCIILKLRYVSVATTRTVTEHSDKEL